MLEGNNISAGQEGFVQFRLYQDEQIIAGPRDRFIMRSLSPVQTLGGGMIIEAIPYKYKRNKSDIILDVLEREKAVLNDRNFIEYAVKKAQNFAAVKNEISIRTKILPEPASKILNDLIKDGTIFDLDEKLYIHRVALSEVKKRLLDIVSNFHKENPESPGIASEQFLEISSLKKDVFDGVINLLIGEGKLVERKNRLALAQYKEQFSDSEQKFIQIIESLFKKQFFSPPSIDEIVEHIKINRSHSCM